MNYLEATKTEKERASRLVMEAIKAGTLQKQTVCEKCGSQNHVVAHHEDYTEPLFVIWLCAGCHRKKHKVRNKRVIAGIEAIAMTAAAAAKHFPGVEERNISRMCLRGQMLDRVYGDKIPAKEESSMLRGKKVGRAWIIPMTELNRVFLS